MKIIATVEKDCVLVQMTAREVANIAGFDNEDSLIKHNGHRRTTGLEVGTTYNICPAWRRLQEQATVTTELQGISKTLVALSNLVTQTEVQYTNCTVETKGEQ